MRWRRVCGHWLEEQRRLGRKRGPWARRRGWARNLLQRVGGCACLFTRSASEVVTRVPTDNSARVIALMNDSLGRSSAVRRPRVGSSVVSMSRRSASGSTQGSPARRRIRSTVGTDRRRNGRSSATSAQSRVTITFRPALRGSGLRPRDCEAHALSPHSFHVCITGDTDPSAKIYASLSTAACRQRRGRQRFCLSADTPGRSSAGIRSGR
jgi:hypothetical protein